ncbi:MAG TPA: hypothetical protein VN641_11780 [Urbifossiella sp.]|nr:hypothetical protein [Urbifossiella sp.]
MAGRFRSLFLVAAFGLAVAGQTLAAPAGVNIALPYPAKAPLVVQVNGVERVKDRLGKMLEALPAAEAKQVKKAADDGFAKLLQGRKLDAVPKDGRLFLVVHDFATLTEDTPALAVLVPATSYKELKTTLLSKDEQKSLEQAGKGIESFKASAGGNDATLYLIELKGYAAVTPNKETAELYAGKFNPAQSGAMGTELSASFLAGDVSLYVNMDAINDLYGAQIRQFKMLIDLGIGQAQGAIPGLGKQQLEAGKIMVGGIFQIIEDSKGLVIAAEFRPQGLNLRGQIRFADETQSADLLKAEKPSDLAELGKLPRGQGSYSGSHLGKKFADLFKKFSQEFAAADDDEKGAERIAKLQTELAAAGRQGEFSASTPPQQSITLSMYKEPGRAATALVDLYSAMSAGGKISSIALKKKPDITDKAATYREFTFSEIKLNFDFAAAVEALPEAAREAALNQFKRLMKEKTTLWVGTNGKVVVQLMAADWAAAKKLLTEALDPKEAVGLDKGFELARKNLPKELSAVMMLETATIVTMMVNQVKTMSQFIPGGAFPQIGSVKPVKGEPTYLAMSLSLKPQLATADMFVAGTAMNVMTRMIAPLFRNVE